MKLRLTVLFFMSMMIIGTAGAAELSVEPVLEHEWMYTSDEPALLRAVVSTGTDSGWSGSIFLTLMTDRRDTVAVYEKHLDGIRRTDTVTFNMELQPGFYRAAFSAVSADGQERRTFGTFNIGCDPEEISSPQDRQEDFGAFWEESLAALAEVEPEYRLTLLPEHSNDVRRTYRVDMKSFGGEPVSGIYVEPVKEGKYPVYITYMGYGASMWYNDPSARPDAAEFTLCIRNQVLNRKPGEKDDWVVRGLADKDTYYYRGAFMDAVRAIDFVASREKVDTARIFAEGGSQGGALTLAAASLDRRIKGIAVFVPFLSDYPDYFRIVNWPADPVLAEAERLGISAADLYRTLSYFDIKNFTDRITCPVLMGFGLQDETCPPHTNFSGYNYITAPKSYITFPLAGHHVETEPGWWEARDAFFKEMDVRARVEDLLSRMTLEEKVGQMNQFVGLEHIRKNEASLSEEDLKHNTANAFYPGFTADSVAEWTRKGLVGSFLHVLTVEEANYLQSLAMQSRLKIPVIFGIDAIHGNANAPDNTVYPTNIGLASSFDLDLAYRIARQTAAEMRAMNMHWTFNPNVEVARDPRWGRVGETFGEDPYLVSKMGVETVRGYQGDLSSDDVLACVKHFVGGSQPINGTNGSPTDLSERTLREVFFPPFEEGVKVGAMSLMTAHNELNGIPCHSNEWLMEDVLRGEWGFKGFVVSDWMDIEHLHDIHAVAENLKEAFYQSIMAGMDMHMHGVYWNEYVCGLVREGRIPESRIDESVRRILGLKFRLGLFEQPYADEKTTMDVRLCEEHRQTALEAARKSIVLLKNDGLLPLSPGKYRRVLVTGINADDHNILGDWSADQRPENVITVLEGLRMVSPGTDFVFVDQGWDPRNMSPEQVDKAASAARTCDLNIVVAGEYMYRGRWLERTSGEDTDRSDIDLVGLQNELIQRVAESGKPTLLILISGRPLGTEWAAEHLPALVNAWEPGMYGGQAIAEILYGRVNPSAKLAVTIPRSVGQTQMIYNHKPSQYFHPYAVTPSTPLYPFGYGLSYNTYEYYDLTLDRTEIPADGSLKVSVKVRNAGKMEGEEIVQLYIRDRFSQVTRPVKELKDFARISLAPGETRTVEFMVTPDKLRFLDKHLTPIVEPGEFILMVGPSSADEDLLKTSFHVL